MRFFLIILFIVFIGAGSARAQVKRSLAPQIAKVTRIITLLKTSNGDSARIAYFERILAEMKRTQAFLDKADPSKVKKPKKPGGVTWSGTLTSESVANHHNEAFQGKEIKRIQVSFSGARPTMNMENDDPELNYTDNKGTGTYHTHGDITMLNKQRCVSDCSGAGVAELHSVIVRDWDKTYDIEAIGPACKGSGNCKEPWEDEGPTITVSNKPLTNKNLLQGSQTITSELPGNLGTITTTITWHLERDQAEDIFIVTPERYDDWLPYPGKNEKDPGGLMVIRLEVKGRNGKEPLLEVDHFELKLRNTSKEPGISLNMPVIPGPPLYDLRFNDELNENTSADGQTTTVMSYDGSTGSVLLDSYDGGGYTTLTAVAVMEDNSRLEGHLLISGGETAIPIPKRPPGSNIGEAWLVRNKNPKDNDDLETSLGNNNDGDGFSAYEEYRGVIADGKFERLDPHKKELAIKMKDADPFESGITKFEVASGVAAIMFRENEIGADRRVNKNNKTAHIYDQYAIHLMFGNLAKDLGKSFGGPGIPRVVSMTVIDMNRIHASYLDRVAEANSINTRLSYSEEDLFETIVAHELAHSVEVEHHGSLPPNSLNLKIEAGRPVRIFDYTVAEITHRPYTLTGRVGEKGNEQSGDADCFMLNNALCDWALISTANAMTFYQVPLIPLGYKLCTSNAGTGLNKKDSSGNNHYFGDATNGNCLSQINLK